jgi:hypothetical protein
MSKYFHIWGYRKYFDVQDFSVQTYSVALDGNGKMSNRLACVFLGMTKRNAGMRKQVSAICLQPSVTIL